MRTAPSHVEWLGAVQVHGAGAGDGLLSRDLAIGVPLALSGLTIVFGMGTSVAPTLWSPAKRLPRDQWKTEQRRSGKCV